MTMLVNESDFESPGYEYLRSHQNMKHLYYKLVALNYQRDFCHLYKCPPIHKYYFSTPNKNAGEQQFLFTCLCAWLIKDKCQMNLELEPEEYQDSNVIIGVIVEALRLLLTPDNEGAKERRDLKNPISFPPGRLRHGFGPEVIWSMNILADRALELMLESGPEDKKATKVIYHSKSPHDTNRQAGSVNSITVGKPFVGGGLTTRPLGSYQVDDASLLFGDDQADDAEATVEASESSKLVVNSDFDTESWYQQVERATQTLESARLEDDNSRFENWQYYLQATLDSRKAIQEFENYAKSLMEAIANRIDRQLQVITGREKFIQTHLSAQIKDFLNIWRDYSLETTKNNALLEQVNSRTDRFESYNDELRQINSQIELRIKELNDGSKLRELESIINRLRQENSEFDVKIGLMLSVYSKVQSKIVSNTGSGTTL